MERWYPPPWALPLIVAALIVPPFAGFALGGAPLGSALGALAVTTLLVIAVRHRPHEAIALARTGIGAPLLAVALVPVEEDAARRIATLAEADPAPETDAAAEDSASVLVLAPIQSTRTQRWLSDEEPGRLAAQERLAVSVATLAAAGCHAEGRVVSQDPVQALEDAAAQYGARRVAFVIAGDAQRRLSDELSERLDCPVDAIESKAGLTGTGPAGADSA